ncbi:MAG: DNA-processing protein DprA, partial [Deltaproteobacteria bacterium]|nr:DNA-processing protein DprA [Deltaproteobacteria bacterium]MBW2531586.1 DNA-processing protein DprA [Deltaproteobacteria bacterium]
MRSEASRRCHIAKLGLPLGAQALARVVEHVWGRRREPPEVYLRGTLPAPTGIAVVGTRRATGEALAFTRGLVADLAGAGFSIWSGAARGIDRAAHEAAIQAGAPTAIVAPTGLDHPYPADHADLYRRVVARGGALISLWPDGSKAKRSQFLKRNRLLAALTAATVIVEAPTRSGARSTA